MHMVVHALVLRETAYKEADKILTVLTRENGKMTLSARGCRRQGSPIAAAAQLLVWSEMTVYEYRGRWSVKEAAAERQFAALRGDLDKLALGCYFAEAAEAVTLEDVPAPEVLSLLLNSLHVLDRLDLPQAQVKAAFELRLMCLSGYAPALERCAACGTQEGPFRLAPEQGELLCDGCRKRGSRALPMSPAVLSALRHIAWSDAKRFLSFRLEGEALEQLAQVCQTYLLAQLERGFRTLDFYLGLQPPQA